MKVFDSSTVLAVIFAEPGADLAAQLMNEDDALISSVSLAEALGKLLDSGMRATDATEICRHLPLKVMPFTPDQAQAAGQLRPSARAFGLSLGDRCCLALTQSQAEATVVTADRPWAALAGFKVVLTR